MATAAPSLAVFWSREGYVSDPEYLLHEERLMLDYARGRWICRNTLR
jgi:hypothetical protein